MDKKTSHVHIKIEPELKALAQQLAKAMRISASEVYRRGVLLLAEQQEANK